MRRKNRRDESAMLTLLFAVYVLASLHPEVQPIRISVHTVLDGFQHDLTVVLQRDRGVYQRMPVLLDGLDLAVVLHGRGIVQHPVLLDDLRRTISRSSSARPRRISAPPSTA